MKTIKVKFVGFWSEFDPENFLMYQLMKKHFDVQICDDPDYIICSCFGFYEYLSYDQVRILFSGENYTPDFNYVDYGISVYPIDFLDRHFSFPGMVGVNQDSLTRLSKKERNYSYDILEKKTYFANMVTGHDSENGLRGVLFRSLNEYRRVESGGSFLNNLPNGRCVWGEEKRELQRRCKFTICPESTIHGGFITEKILDAFESDSIPIYCGSSTISEIINKNAYLDVNDFACIDDLVARVIELDKSDDLYLEMLNQPIFVEEDYIANKFNEFERFVVHIFEQPLDKAFRRSRSYMPKRIEQSLSRAAHLSELYNKGKILDIWLLEKSNTIKKRISNIFR